MDLAQALRFDLPAWKPGPEPAAQEIRVAFIGAGGKTTLLFRLARDLLARQSLAPYPSVFATTTTHLAVTQLALADRSFQVDSPSDLNNFMKSTLPGLSLFVGRAGEDERVAGPTSESLERLAELCRRQAIPLLIEADGSRMRPLKAPAEHEPALPPFANTVICVAGLSALGKPLSGEWVHRPERFAALSGLAENETLTPQALARVLKHPLGGLKSIPPAARRVVLLNQADTPALVEVARRLAPELLSSFDAVIVTGREPTASPDSSTVSPPLSYQPVAAILLAAGEARRYGQPKQLLDWKGQPFVRHVVQAALSAGLSSVILITGAYADQVAQAVDGLPVEVVHNSDWRLGLSTSLKAGLQALPARTGAALFLLSDQPHVPVELIQALKEAHARTLSPLVASRCQGRRLNPVLFDRSVFPELMALQGDVGGRRLFEPGSPYPVEWVPWEDDSLFLDVDTPADYARLKAMEK